jgi:hypothetical protein
MKGETGAQGGDHVRAWENVRQGHGRCNIGSVKSRVCGKQRTIIKCHLAYTPINTHLANSGAPAPNYTQMITINPSYFRHRDNLGAPAPKSFKNVKINPHFCQNDYLGAPAPKSLENVKISPHFRQNDNLGAPAPKSLKNVKNNPHFRQNDYLGAPEPKLSKVYILRLIFLPKSFRGTGA